MSDVTHDSGEARLSPKQATPSARREPRSRILTVLLSLLLLDAAVETFSSGAPVRWWVAGVVAAYLGLAVVVVRRVPDTLVSWSRLATASVFVLLGLLAWTAWLPGGLTNGVAMLRQPTAVVLSAMGAFAVAIAGGAVVRARFLPWWGRMAFGFLALYGVAAFVLGIMDGTTYSALFNGGSQWRRLPYWLQGAFVGSLVTVPLAIAAGIFDAFKRLRAPDGRGWGFEQSLALALITLMAVSGLTADARIAVGDAAPAEVSSRGPGMRQATAGSITLPVPRTSELVHVEPAHYAAALAKDPVRIFDFLRDSVAFEAYTGLLRGPRGTLMALAGNSVDRAALLGAMLQQSGQRVRYARGTLPEKDARDLVISMWAERPQLARSQAAIPPDPALVAAGETLIRAFKRDYISIRDQLEAKGRLSGNDPGPSLADLARGAQAHWWVQWAKEGQWIDLDPSFVDAVPGRTYAQVEETFNDFPETLLHRVRIRVRVEEYFEGHPTTRDVLTFATRAADLSGVDIFLSHQPENWKGPTGDLGGALDSAIESTGRVQPVLIAGNQIIVGEAFQQRAKPAGIGGIKDLLSGRGSQEPVRIASAESLALEFSGPGHQPETVERELFDVLGKARRRAGRTINSGELHDLTQAEGALDMSRAVYALFFTTGTIAPAHLHKLTDAPLSQEASADIRRGLVRVALIFSATADAILGHLREPSRGGIVIYPDSPRVQILDATERSGQFRFSLDLRRQRSLVARVPLRSSRGKSAEGIPYPEDVFAARIFKGVVEGTLERVLGEYIAAASPQVQLRSILSTSSVFDRAEEENVKIVLLDQGASPRIEVPEDAKARVHESLSRGDVVTPVQAVTVDDRPRIAWWAIDPRSGETIGITDEGLYQTGTDYTVTVLRGPGTGPGGQLVAGWYVRVFYRGVLIFSSFFTNSDRLRDYLLQLFLDILF